MYKHINSCFYVQDRGSKKTDAHLFRFRQSLKMFRIFFVTVNYRIPGPRLTISISVQNEVENEVRVAN